MKFMRNTLLEANLGKPSKLTTKVQHPGNCKLNVLTALVIFNETTAAAAAAAIQCYLPDETSTDEFLKLFSIWQIIASSKTAFSTNNYLGNEAVNEDQKPSFQEAMAEWVQV